MSVCAVCPPEEDHWSEDKVEGSCIENIAQIWSYIEIIAKIGLCMEKLTNIGSYSEIFAKIVYCLPLHVFVSACIRECVSVRCFFANLNMNIKFFPQLIRNIFFCQFFN